MFDLLSAAIVRFVNWISFYFQLWGIEKKKTNGCNILVLVIHYYHTEGNVCCQGKKEHFL